MTLRCPSHLCAEAKKEWRRVTRFLPDGALLEADRGMLELYCSAFGDARELEAELAITGRTVTTPNGHLQPAPAWTQLRQARADACRFAVQLGLTPKSRRALGLAKPDEDDESDFK